MNLDLRQHHAPRISISQEEQYRNYSNWTGTDIRINLAYGIGNGLTFDKFVIKNFLARSLTFIETELSG